MMEMISIDKLIFRLQHERAFTLRAEKDRMEHGTEGKAAPVTGAAQGLAQAGATVLAAPGVAGAAADFRVEQAESVALEVRVVGMAPDVGLVCASLEGAAGAPKTLANNVGFTPDSRIANTLKQDWNALNDPALNWAFPCAGAALAPIFSRGRGRIVSIFSTARLGNPGQASQSAAKVGILGFSQAFALKRGGSGVTANTAAPGIVDTTAARGTAASRTYRRKRQGFAHNPPQRLVRRPSRCGSIPRIEAASFCTGRVLRSTE